MEFDYKWVADPEIFAINRVDAHSDHKYYRTEAEAAGGSSSFRYSLFYIFSRWIKFLRNLSRH